VSSSRTETTLVEVTMPQMGVSVAEGTVVEWKKRVGDWVEADEPIVEISTDKVETEVPSPATGRVTAIVVEVGATVDVGTVLAAIDTDDRPGQPHVDEEQAPPISPVVRRIADEHHIDLAQIKGSGRRGRVTKRDVMAVVENGAERPLHIESPYVEEPAPPSAGEPLSVMRRRIGEHMRQSLDTAAHCTTVV
jgi:pyruvate/2-oxoglutarate dehydrogenase complex dihydrolipoamide acyltransferase (E2) component